GRCESQSKPRRQPAEPAMLIRQPERFSGSGDVEQQRMRQDDEQDVYRMSPRDHLSENDRNLSILEATTSGGAGTFAKEINPACELVCSSIACHSVWHCCRRPSGHFRPLMSGRRANEHFRLRSWKARLIRASCPATTSSRTPTAPG